MLSRLFIGNEVEAAEIGGDILWDKIASVEYIGYEHVYDIEVEGTHNFIGNGIFAHNTYMNKAGPDSSTTGMEDGSHIGKSVGGGMNFEQLQEFAKTHPAEDLVEYIRLTGHYYQVEIIKDALKDDPAKLAKFNRLITQERINERGQASLKPNWIKVEGDDIEFFSSNMGSILFTRKVKFKGKTYWAKYTDKQIFANLFLIPQADLVCYLNILNIRGLAKAEYFLETDGFGKMILFEDLEETHPGMPLTKAMERNDKYSEQIALDIIIKVSKVVQEMHNAGVCHWDIKPGNIWIANNGEIFLFDFDTSFKTLEEFIGRMFYAFGTFDFMSGNRHKWDKERRYDVNSELFPPFSDDIYSIALTLLYMLTGGILTFETTNGHLEATKNLQEVLRKALSGGKCRYKTANRFIRDLEKCQKDTTSPVLPKTKPIPDSELIKRYEDEVLSISA